MKSNKSTILGNPLRRNGALKVTISLMGESHRNVNGIVTSAPTVKRVTDNNCYFNTNQNYRNVGI